MAAGIRSLLAFWLGGASSTPAPATPIASREVTVRAFDRYSGAFIASWARRQTLDITFGKNGPDIGNVAIPVRLDDGTFDPVLDVSRLLPGGHGPLIEVDARALGVPEVWLGMAQTAPEGSDVTVASLGLVGPQGWLVEESVADAGRMDGAAGGLLAGLYANHPSVTRVRVNLVHSGPDVVPEVAGATLWEATGELEELGLVRAYFSARPGEAMLELNVLDQLASAFDPRRRFTLYDTGELRNCSWEAETNLVPGTEELIVMGQEWQDGTVGNTVVARAAGGTVLGRHAALSASVSTTLMTAIAGQGRAEVRPDLGATPSLLSQADSLVRRGLSPVAACTVDLHDEALWPYCKPGTLVETRFEQSYTGLWRRSVGEIQQVTFGLEPARRCQLGIELWAVL